MALHQEVLDAAKRRPGFVSFQAAGKEETRALCTVTTWDNEEAAVQPVQEAYGNLMMRVLALVKIESMETYKVTASVS